MMHQQLEKLDKKVEMTWQAVNRKEIEVFNFFERLMTARSAIKALVTKLEYYALKIAELEEKLHEKNVSRSTEV